MGLHVIMCVWANIYLRLLILIRTHLKIYFFPIAALIEPVQHGYARQIAGKHKRAI